MGAVSSTMLDLGTTAPDFSLPDPAGAIHTLADVMGEKGLLVAFICNHCPFVKHLRDQLAELGHEAQAMGVGVVAIMPNDVENYPDDAPDKMAEEAASAGYTFPYLYDVTQAVAKDYHAACTPDFYVFDANAKLAYRGQMDDTRPKHGTPATGDDLRAAIKAVAAGESAAECQSPSIGCNIKWKPGNEPAYFNA